MTVASLTLTEAAERTAYLLLGDMGDRWRHTRGVAERAAELAGALDLDADLLVASAWLHDIGYAGCTADTGFRRACADLGRPDVRGPDHRAHRRAGQPRAAARRNAAPARPRIVQRHG